MGEEFWIKLFGNVAFPTAICFYTLFEVNKNVKKLSASIDRMTNDVDRRLNELEKGVYECKYALASKLKGE
ncbi:MAG: hypothetical protein IKT98_10375 [Selenomonadaceae bacterium]|nr:hypothetical protein [Selenomonadaceae bacterium]